MERKQKHFALVFFSHSHTQIAELVWPMDHVSRAATLTVSTDLVRLVGFQGNK